MDKETLNLEYLKSFKACKEGLNFVKNNKLENFPISRLYEIEGDFRGFKGWLTEELKTEREYDQNGNKIKETYPDGRTYEYDQNGNKIKETLPSGRTWTYEYDQYGNLTKRTGPDGTTWTYEYDQNGNLTKETYPDGRTWTYEYKRSEKYLEILANSKLICKIPLDF